MCPFMYRLRLLSASPLPPPRWLVGKQQGAPFCSPFFHVHGVPPKLVPSSWNRTLEQEQDSTPSGVSILSSSCAPCRLTGPGDGPQPQLTATHTAELSHAPQGPLTLGTA